MLAKQSMAFATQTRQVRWMLIKEATIKSMVRFELVRGVADLAAVSCASFTFGCFALPSGGVGDVGLVASPGDLVLGEDV